MKTKISLILILSLLLPIFKMLIFLVPDAEAAETVVTTTFTGNGGGYHPTSIIENLETQVLKKNGYKIKSYKFTINGNQKGQLGKYNEVSGKIELPAVNGKALQVEGTRASNMYYDIWRTSNGESWTMATQETGSYTFIADISTQQNGVSKYPGKIPTTDISGRTIDSRLRYSNGDAAAWSDALGVPDKMLEKGTSNEVPYSKIEPSSIEIVSATPASSAFHEVSDHGKGKPGYGYVKVKLSLGSEYNIEDVHWERAPGDLGGENNVQGRRYNLISNTSWIGTTYIVNYNLTVTYEKTASTKPDLIADSITGPSTIEIGKPATFTANYHNENLDVTQPFNVKVTDQTGTVLKLETIPSLKKDTSGALIFASTFTSNTPRTFTFAVDSAGAITEENEDNNIVSATFTPGSAPSPSPGQFTGDFDVIKPVTAYRETFSLKPKDFNLNQCTYISHIWQIKQGMFTYTSPAYSTYPNETSYSFDKWPSFLGVGTFQVYMLLKTNCGEQIVGPKTLTITGPSNNAPPQIKIGWIDPAGDPAKPIPTAYEGQALNLNVLSLSDSDGDDVTFEGYDFSGNSSQWIQNIPSRYGGETMMWEYPNVLMENPGYFTICASVRDQWGAVGSGCANITVVPPNPVAVIDGPDQVKQNRPLTSPFTSTKSYSPIKERVINHSKDEWSGDIRTNYETPGKVEIRLNVYDSLGLKSLQPAVHELTVLEDMPPTPRMDFPTPSLRNINVPFKNTSYSPDGDIIVENRVTYRYDSNNNGSYTEETTRSVTMRSDKTFDFKCTKVGRYQFIVYVKEDYGKEASQNYTLNCINDSPTVSFDIKSEAIAPEPVVPVAMKGNVVANWKNSDFQTDGKTSSWSYNEANGALSLLFTSFRRNELSFGPSPGGTYVFDSGVISNVDSDFKGAKSLGNGYFAVEAGGSPMGYNIYKFENGSFQHKGFRESLRIYGVDYGKGIVYTAQNWVWGGGDRTFKWYYVDSFINPAGQPFRTSDFILINGSIIYRFGNSSTISSNGISGRFADYFYDYKEDGSGYTYGHKRIIVNWDGTSKVEAPELWTDPDGIKREWFYGSQYANTPNNQMQYLYNVSSYSTRPSGVRQGISLWDVDQDQLIMEGLSTYSSYSGVAQTLDGKWGFTTHDIIDIKNRAATLNAPYNGPYNPTSLFTWDNIALGGYAQPRKLNSDGSTTTNPGTKDFAGLLDNNNYSFYISGGTLKKENANTGQVVDVAGGSGLSYPSLQLNDDGTVIGYESDSGNFGTYTGRTVIFYDPSAAKRKEAKSVSTHNQLLGTIRLKNAAFNFKLRLNMSTGSSELFSGFSFSAQDHRNMYRVELNQKKVQLVKVSGGNRVVLQHVDYPFSLHQSYSVKLQYLDNKIKVYVDGTPVIDIMDNSYSNGGTFGPFAEIPKTEILNMSYADLNRLSSSTIMNGVAIIDSDIAYSISGSDTENDPFIKERTAWKYTQLNFKFLDAGDGRSGSSAHNNKTYTAPLNRLDKVGLYRVSYTVTDDPNTTYPYPKTEFNDYRQKSNTYIRDVIVHRRPVSDFDLSIASNGTVLWSDRSRDLDRYLNSSIYSSENTGIDYARTKGVLEKKFYYISPSGKFVSSKLVAPEEIGEYTVGLAVKDEYEAWSDFTEKTIYIGNLPQPDQPPHAGFQLSHSISYRGVAINVNSMAWDKEDGGRSNLKHEYFIRNLDGGTETMASQNREGWSKTFSSMGTFRFRQVVEDKLGQTATAINDIQIINRIPTAALSVPSSSNQNIPEKLIELRPGFRWGYSDSDGDPESKYQVIVYRYGGALIYDSGIQNGNALTYKPVSDLPERIYMYVTVRVFDGYDWGESAARYFYIETNRPPEAEFDWSPKPVYEGDRVQLLNRSTDPDGDELTELWEVRNPLGQVQTFHDAPVIQSAIPGEYKIRLEVSDGKAQAFVTKSIHVVPLHLDAEVEHTEQWKAIHVKAGHETEHNPKEFYAGEKLIVHGYPVPAEVSQVTVKLSAVGKLGDKIETTTALNMVRLNEHYTGELFDERWGELASGLPKGDYTLQFEVIYRNGVRKNTELPIRIIGFAKASVGVHRKQ